MGGDKVLSNANDVVIKFGDAKTGSGRIVCSDWSFSGSTDGELAHGASNQNPVALSEGNSTFEFELTFTGEDKNVWENSVHQVSTDNSFVGSGAIDIVLIVKTKMYTFTYSTAWVLDWEFSGSDGEDNELNVSGVALEPSVSKR